jgi:hypothetical protein
MGQGKGIVVSFRLEPKNIGSWSRRIEGVGASFRLEPINQGVIASFHLDPENTGSHTFLQVGACKSRGRSLLPFGAREHREL